MTEERKKLFLRTSMKLLNIHLLILIMSVSVYAKDIHRKEVQDAISCEPQSESEKLGNDLVRLADASSKRCPNMFGLSQICGLLRSRQETQDKTNNNGITYQYQFNIYRAACVDTEKDDEVLIRKKVQEFWRIYGRELTCDALSFDVPNGSLLKYGVSDFQDDFIDDVTENWGVDLNQVDQTGETVLDYISKRMKEKKGPVMERILKKYYMQFREAGAKHKSEL